MSWHSDAFKVNSDVRQQYRNCYKETSLKLYVTILATNILFQINELIDNADYYLYFIDCTQ